MHWSHAVRKQSVLAEKLFPIRRMRLAFVRHWTPAKLSRASFLSAQMEFILSSGLRCSALKRPDILA